MAEDTDTKVAEGIITKVDGDKRLVFGWASVIKDVSGAVLLDRQNDFIDSEDEMERSAYEYVLKSRDGGEMHVRKGVSTMVESMVFTLEKQAALGIPPGIMPVGWWIGFRVNDSNVWDMVKKGDYPGFSVHGTGRRNPVDMLDIRYTEIGKGSDCDCAQTATTKVSTAMLGLLTKAQNYRHLTVAPKRRITK